MTLRTLERPEIHNVATLHNAPFTSLSRFVLSRRMWPLAISIGGAIIVLAFVARFGRSWLTLRIDRPITEWALNSRSTTASDIFLRISWLGSTEVVLVGGAVLALLALPKCRLVAGLVALATLLRPPIEYALKELIDRPRPDLGRLVGGVGPSFPSGHVLAAAVLWTMVPVVLSLYLPSRRLWQITSALSALMVLAIGASRVYLGVHWASDVIAGFLVAIVMLTAFDRGYRQLHRNRHCDGRDMIP